VRAALVLSVSINARERRLTFLRSLCRSMFRSTLPHGERLPAHNPFSLQTKPTLLREWQAMFGHGATRPPDERSLLERFRCANARANPAVNPVTP
jgi:hypothetical protein